MGKQEQKYRIGRHHHRKSRKNLWVMILVVLLVLLGAGTYVVVRAISNSDTKISMPAPITREYAPEDEESKVLEQGGFTVRLPQDWRLAGREQNTQYNLYQFQSMTKGQDNRKLEIYVDSTPFDKAFNRILPVIVDNNQIIIKSSVSDNCTTFTGDQDGEIDTSASRLKAKWQGVSFICDMANVSRNVVGVGTSETGHTLTLRGNETGQKNFYVVYIDHNIHPDYHILERALESIEVK